MTIASTLIHVDSLDQIDLTKESLRQLAGKEDRITTSSRRFTHLEHPILVCSKPPSVGEAKATYRRLRIIPFTSKWITTEGTLDHTDDKASPLNDN